MSLKCAKNFKIHVGAYDCQRRFRSISPNQFWFEAPFIEFWKPFDWNMPSEHWYLRIPQLFDVSLHLCRLCPNSLTSKLGHHVAFQKQKHQLETYVSGLHFPVIPSRFIYSNTTIQSLKGPKSFPNRFEAGSFDVLVTFYFNSWPKRFCKHSSSECNHSLCRNSWKIQKLSRRLGAFMEDR